jgi:hypothetical protein
VDRDTAEGDDRNGSSGGSTQHLFRPYMSIPEILVRGFKREYFE